MVSNRPFHCDTRVNDIALPNLSKDDLSILAYLRADVIKKLKKCRKSPSSSFTVSPVSPHFAENYFGFFCDSGLWTRCPDARDAVVFYSHYFQAGCVFAALDELFGTQPPRIANGSILVGDRGDIASLAPPFRARIKRHFVGPEKTGVFYSLDFDCQILVVPATLNSTVALHPLAPQFSDAKRWIILPEYADVKAHCQQHIQVLASPLDKTKSLAVVSTSSWTFDEDELPNQDFGTRPADRVARAGQIWSETNFKWVKFQNARHKDNVLHNNVMIHARRLQAVRDRLAARDLEALVQQTRRDNARQNRRQNKMKATLVETLPEDDSANSYSENESLDSFDLEYLRNNR